MKTRGLVMVALLVLAGMGFATTAQAESGDMRLQFGFLYSMPTDDLEGDGETFQAQSTFGFQASFEYLFTHLIGLEPQISMSSYDVDVVDAEVPDFKLGDTDLLALTVNLNFHLFRESKVDLYLGATVGYGFWGDLESGVFDTKSSTDDSPIYGATLGVNVPFGESKWEFSGALNYQAMEVALTGDIPGEDLGINPFQIRAGVAYRF